PVQSAYMSSPTTRLPPEARRVTHVSNRQVLGTQDYIAVEIGNGYFRGRNKVEVVVRNMIHLPFLVGKLTGTVAGGFIYQDWRLNFGVAFSAGLIQEEVDECTL